MLSHSTIEGESSRMSDKRTAATKGNRPKIMLRRLYFPVRCMTHLRILSIHRISANMRPTQQRGIRTRSTRRSGSDAHLHRISPPHTQPLKDAGHAPASLALVSMTVWNQVGKLYMTVKLHVATRKLLMPTRTGIFCCSRNGASTGSGATYSST